MSIKILITLLLVGLLTVGCANQMGREHAQQGTQPSSGYHDLWWY
ncbi:hypothetical protein ACFPTY_18965 [Halomonas beimenensis]|uniref:Lipoprotein n=1 Tax=Halomonas beimenensis TaxID=475662 RepID=A0A291P344_9GAMM|nr:hypothetical protein [Halomonas beimenensis]ATJ81301.1 hypothetical protein BEI_0314 [Halomonas beimenensis]